MSSEIVKLVNEHKRNKWRDHIDKCTLSGATDNLWRTIKPLSKPQAKTNNLIISFDGNPITDSRRSATLFNKQFTPHPDQIDKMSRKIVRLLHKLPPSDNTNMFSEDEVLNAIKATKTSKACGADGISPVMLKHLGQAGIKYITGMLNMSISSLKIPNVWKLGRIIPLLKPSKPIDQSTSYRPISLLSPIDFWKSSCYRH